MSQVNKRYSEEFKLSVIRDYYSSGMSKNACVRKYGLCSDGLLRSWLKKYDIQRIYGSYQSSLIL